VDPVSLMVVAGAGFGAWLLHRSQRGAQRTLASGPMFDEDGEVALHVARHEAKTRRHMWMSPVHLLYGLVQDEKVAEAIRAGGADVDALEDRVLAELDACESNVEAGRVTGGMMEYARVMAEHSGRRPGLTDLWAALRWGEGVVALLEAASVDHVGVLFRLFHGEEPAAAERLTGDVDVVLRNDHYTTKEFVCELLQEVFALPPADATARMEETHQQGETVVGRYRAADARAKVADAQQRAKAGGFPLWIGVVPA
jgi:ATP-dependent Clp protease adaptor protein ClpS